MAWLTGYKKRKQIPVAGSPDGALANYQMKVTAHSDNYYFTAKRHGAIGMMVRYYPQAAYYNGYTYFVFEGPRLAPGTQDGDPYITRYKHSTGMWDTPVRIGPNPAVAASLQSMPVVIVRTDAGHVGHILVCWGGYGGGPPSNLLWAESTNAEDITVWPMASSFGSQAMWYSMTQVANGDIYLIHRPGTNGRIGYKKMASGASVWGAETDLINLAGGGLDEVDSSIPAYDSTNNIIWYASGRNETVTFAYIKIWVWGFDITNNKIVDAAGNQIALPISEANLDNAAYKFKIFSSVLPIRTFDEPAIALDATHHPHVTYKYYPGAGAVTDYYTYWDGAVWTAAMDIGTSTGGSQTQIRVNAVNDIDMWVQDWAHSGGPVYFTRWHYNGVAWSWQEDILALAGEPGPSFTGTLLVQNGQPELYLIFGNTNFVTFDNQRLYAWGSGGLVKFKAPGFVTLDGHALTDFADVRFTRSDAVTELDYWRENYVASQWADFWIELNTIPVAPGTGIYYVYYGKVGDITTSNGVSTFLAFDDFESDVVGVIPAGWTEVENPANGTCLTIAGGFSGKGVEIVCAAAAYAANMVAIAANKYAVEYFYKRIANNHEQNLYGAAGAYHVTARITAGSNFLQTLVGPPTNNWVDTVFVKETGHWHKVMWHVNEDTGKYNFYHDLVLLASAKAIYGADISMTNLGSRFQETGTVDLDRILVRGWTPTEPTWGPTGSEEQLMMAVANQNRLVAAGAI